MALNMAMLAGDLMINPKPSNEKRKQRGIRIVSDITGEAVEKAEVRLEANNWVIREVIK